MIELAEADLIELSQMIAFPIVPCSLCSGQADHRRKYVSQLLTDLEKGNPDLKNVMLGATKNVRPTHLLDLSIRKDNTKPAL
jgi:tRNA 2-thiocytidine biosynthesis protein TtcA